MDVCVSAWFRSAKPESKGEFVVSNRTLNPGFRDNLERWDGKGGKRQVEGGGRVCTCGRLMLIVAEASTEHCGAALLPKLYFVLHFSTLLQCSYASIARI